MRLTRTEPPDWLQRGGGNLAADAWERLSGEQAEWGYVIPQVYRALADPESGHELMRAPTEGDEIFVGCAYWAALLHLTTYTLGWIHPHRALRAWQDHGAPIDDVRLSLLSKVWMADGMLDWLHAWTYSLRLQGVTDELAQLVGFHDDEDQTDDLERDWVEAQKNTASRRDVPAPISHGGYDRLHLAGHLSGPLRQSGENVELFRTDPKRRRAVLLVDSMIGWYRALAESTVELPDLGDRGWHVEVVVRPVGSLGVYRRSRTTGIWFAGPHRYHLLGIRQHT